jgi:hypothetical protein
MPLTATLTEEFVHGLAPDEATFQRAQEIARAKRFQNLGVSADGTWLFGDCQGSAKEPYATSADFHEANAPVLRSSSPSRKFPDKYSLALLLTYLNDPGSFGTREAGEDLLIKREKKIVLDEKKKSGSAVPRKMNKAATEKKVAAQREGLDLLEKLLVDLVAAGQWFEPSRLEKIDRQSKQLSDAYLPAPMYGLRKLTLIAKQKDLNEDERMAYATDLVGSLWATVQKGRAYLDQKLQAGESQADADAVIEDVLGKTWQLAELREKGYFQTNLSLFELAFERIDDESRQQRVEISNLLDLSNGAIHQSTAYRPFKGLNQIPEQTSYTTPLTVAEAAIYPGFINRRIRWEKGIEQLIENPPASQLADVYKMANPDFKSALDAFRGQLKHALAPREAVFFLRCKRIGKIGERVIIEDADGTRIEMKDRRKDYSNAANLIRAAGMMNKDRPALLVRLFVLPVPNAIVALPLAALTAKHHLRLGL